MGAPWLVKFNSTGTGDHDHTGVYAAAAHDHDTRYAPAATTLTESAGTVTVDLNSIPVFVGTLAITGDWTLAFSNAPANYAVGTIIVTQDGTGGHTLALPAGHKVVNGGAGVLTLTATANAEDKLMFEKIGSTYRWVVGLDYTAA